MPKNRPPLGDAVVNYLQLGDSATATLTLHTDTGARMSGIRLTYVTTDGRTHEVLLTEGQPSAELEGVRLVSYTHGIVHGNLPPMDYSIQSVTVECFDPDTATMWRATSTQVSASFYRGVALTFTRVA